MTLSDTGTTIQQDLMKRTLSGGWMLALWLCLAGVAQSQPAASPAAQADAPSSSTLLDEAAQTQLLVNAMGMVKAGHGAEAIAGPIDQVIRDYEAAYAHSKIRMYCAGSVAESMMYLTTAASEHANASVLKPTWAMAYYVKAYVLEDQGNLPDAEANLLRALKLSPSNSKYLSELGAVYQREKVWPKALKAYQDAEAGASLARDNEKTLARCRALRGQGFVLVEQHQLDDAEKKYDECLSINPGDQGSMKERGYVEQLKAKPAG